VEEAMSSMYDDEEPQASVPPQPKLNHFYFSVEDLSSVRTHLSVLMNKLDALRGTMTEAAYRDAKMRLGNLMGGLSLLMDPRVDPGKPELLNKGIPKGP
jgi:hypothetical protein